MASSFHDAVTDSCNARRHGGHVRRDFGGEITAAAQSMASPSVQRDSRVPPLKLAQPWWLPLTGLQIVALLHDHTLRVDEDYRPVAGVRVETYSDGACPTSETFASNGAWSRFVCHRGARTYRGTWAAEKFRGGERLCVEAPDFPKLCRFVWQGASRNEVFTAADPARGESQDDPSRFNSYRMTPSGR
jgi:hypothetical protein